VDFNIVMNEFGDFIEVQGTAEGEVFSRKELVEMLDLAGSGISSLIDIQKSALGFTGEEERELAVARDRIRQLEQK